MWGLKKSSGDSRSRPSKSDDLKPVVCWRRNALLTYLPLSRKTSPSRRRTLMSVRGSALSAW